MECVGLDIGFTLWFKVRYRVERLWVVLETGFEIRFGKRIKVEYLG